MFFLSLGLTMALEALLRFPPVAQSEELLRNKSTFMPHFSILSRPKRIIIKSLSSLLSCRNLSSEANELLAMFPPHSVSFVLLFRPGCGMKIKTESLLTRRDEGESKYLAWMAKE